MFFRPGCLAQLELNRDEKFTGIVEQFQAMCRGYLGRKKLEKLKVECLNRLSLTFFVAALSSNIIEIG